MRFIENSRFLALGGVVASLAAVILAFAAAGLKLFKVLLQLLRGDPAVTLGLLQSVDTVLIGAALLIMALGIYELFVGPLQLPRGIGASDFEALKQKLAGVVVLVMAVIFVERLETTDDPRAILGTGAAIAVMTGVLIWFTRGGPRASKIESPHSPEK